MLPISEATIGMWFVPIKGRADFSGILNKVYGEDHDWEFLCRFHYYKTEQIFESEGVFSYKVAEIKGSKEAALDAVRHMCEAVRSGFLLEEQVEEILANSPKEFMEILKTKSWAHCKEVSEEELKDMGVDVEALKEKEKEGSWPKEI